MDEKQIREYARLIVRVGANVQKDQTVVIACPVDCAEFGRKLIAEAYEAGARDVIVDWRDDAALRLHYLNAREDLFDRIYPWTAMQKNTLAREGAAYIAVDGSDPENLKGVDPERIRRRQNAAGRDLKEFYRLQMTNGFPWCIAAFPIDSWAKKVFPNEEPADAKEKLWEAIRKSVRISENGDAVFAWREHLKTLAEKAEKINAFRFTQLHYQNALGTDLTVKLPQKYRFESGADKSLAGTEFVANMPTEEVFSAPEKEGVDGVICASRPLCLHGNIVDGIRLVLEKGRIVRATAKVGQETLESAIATDEGSHYLGEIALVPDHSPISQSGLLFYNTLFDENASCHFAFGEAYPGSIEGGDKMSVEELKAAGINAESDAHVDFMVGTADLSITGLCADGRTVPVFENGDFAF